MVRRVLSSTSEPKLEFGSSHEKFDVRPQPETIIQLFRHYKMPTVLASADIIQIFSTLDGYQELAGDLSELEKERYFE